VVLDEDNEMEDTPTLQVDELDYAIMNVWLEAVFVKNKIKSWRSTLAVTLGMSCFCDGALCVCPLIASSGPYCVILSTSKRLQVLG